MFVKMMQQDYGKYTAEDHRVWSILFGRQQEVLAQRATREHLDGLKRIGFEPDRIPNFSTVNGHLRQLTGWQVQAVPGIVADDAFFRLLASKKFPATTWIRKMKDLDYIEEPDMFHDVYGHVPILSNQPFCDFLEGLGKVALDYIEDAWAVELMSRLYWFTVEFGLIEEGGQLRIYGAGILSSPGESKYSLESGIPQRQGFDVPTIFDTPYIKEKFQVKYYIIDSYHELFHCLDGLALQLAQGLQQNQRKRA